MAITIDDFSKIWASTSPLTPYSFSESNYKEGWNFVGATPPSRQMWDFLQKNNDEKMQYLANNYLPLSGGTMTGTLVTTQAITVRQNADNASSQVYGGTDGTSSKLVLFGKANDGYPGAFSLEARDGSNATSLYGTPNGSLTWNGKEVERVNSSGINYIRYESGLQLHYQSVAIPANTTNGVKIFTYLVPFVSVISVQATPLGIADGKLSSFASALNRSGTQYQIQVATATNTVPTYDTYVYVFAIGYWK